MGSPSLPCQAHRNPLLIAMGLLLSAHQRHYLISSAQAKMVQVLTFCDVAIIIAVECMRLIIYCPVVASIC